MKDWEEALECRIRDIQMNSALGEQPENSTARDAKLQEELLEWLEYYVSNALSLNAGAAAPGTGSTAATSSPAPSVAAPTSIPSTPPSTLTRASSSSATASPPLHGRGAITNTNDTEQRRVGALLYQVLEQWAIHQLDVEVFEQYLLNQLHKFGAALVWLLEEHYREQQARVADAQIMASVPAISSSSSSSSSSSNLLEGSVSESDELPMPWVLPFSSQLYIAAASFGLEQARLMQPASTINTDNLKASIMENLSKDLAKRDVVVLDGLSFSGAASSSSSSSSSSYSFAAKGSTTVDDPMVRTAAATAAASRECSHAIRHTRTGSRCAGVLVQPPLSAATLLRYGAAQVRDAGALVPGADSEHDRAHRRRLPSQAHQPSVPSVPVSHPEARAGDARQGPRQESGAAAIVGAVVTWSQRRAIACVYHHSTERE